MESLRDQYLSQNKPKERTVTFQTCSLPTFLTEYSSLLEPINVPKHVHLLPNMKKDLYFFISQDSHGP